uniref:Uncharacterized protein n=1 Tax=Megaselia scalaris TaxID=36166 RepID=T1GE97_MEGSC
MFLDMVSRNEGYMQRKAPRVFPLHIFEVGGNIPLPRSKTELQGMLRNNKAIPFHKKDCVNCNNVPKAKEWVASIETGNLGVFLITKRKGSYVHWEPIYIGTNTDPHYDERLGDTKVQNYALCLLDYEFHLLNNAFLIHKSDGSLRKYDFKAKMLMEKENLLIKKTITAEVDLLFGSREGCYV